MNPTSKQIVGQPGICVRCGSDQVGHLGRRHSFVSRQAAEDAKQTARVNEANGDRWRRFTLALGGHPAVVSPEEVATELKAFRRAQSLIASPEPNAHGKPWRTMADDALRDIGLDPDGLTDIGCLDIAIEEIRKLRRTVQPPIAVDPVETQAVSALSNFVRVHESYPDQAVIAHSSNEDMIRMGTLRTLLKLLTVIVLLLALPLLAYGQYPKFLGESDPFAAAVTPRHHITVWTGGFDHIRAKQINKKLPGKCLNAGIPADQCVAAQDYARTLPDMLAQIDGAADHVVSVWAACGGDYASFARSFDWSRITLTVKDTVFPNPDMGVISGGITKDDGRTVWVVNLFFQGWFSDRAHASLATMEEFARWELANAVVWRFYGHPKDIGDTAPCR